MVEARGGKEDTKLKNSFTHLCENGGRYLPANYLQKRLTSRELKLKLKKDNVAGLQLADLIAHPSHHNVLKMCNRLEAKKDDFGESICAILHSGKYLRHPTTGKTRGYGQKLLP